MCLNTCFLKIFTWKQLSATFCFILFLSCSTTTEIASELTIDETVPELTIDEFFLKASTELALKTDDKTIGISDIYLDLRAKMTIPTYSYNQVNGLRLAMNFKSG